MGGPGEASVTVTVQRDPWLTVTGDVHMIAVEVVLAMTVIVAAVVVEPAA